MPSALFQRDLMSFSCSWWQVTPAQPSGSAPGSSSLSPLVFSQVSAHLSLLFYKYDWLPVTLVWAGAFKLWKRGWSGHPNSSALRGFLCRYPAGIEV